jgi:hypothetical protein
MGERLPFPFGPFDKGVIDGGNIALDLPGVAKKLRGFYADGIGRLRIAPGTKVAMTLKDDQGTPANITSVVALAEFEAGALAVGHSTVTSKFYLYRFDAELTGWFNSGGVFQANLNAEPVGVLWSTAPNPAKVIIAEGAGEAFIAHNEAASSFQTRKYSVAGGISNLLADLRGLGTEVCYFRGVASFQEHLWGWGFGSLAAGQGDRPELLRFGYATFATTAGSYFAQADSFTVGHRLRSARERIAGAIVAGQVMYVGTNFSMWPITGFGRNSWDRRRPASTNYGMVGPFAGCPAGPEESGEAFYWSHRGPLIAAGYQVAPLWDALPETVKGIVDPQNIVCVPDLDTDQILVFYRGPTSGTQRLLAAFDVRRRVFFGPDRDMLTPVACAAHISIPTVGAQAAAGPSAPPNTPSTTNIGGSVATANWVAGDTSPGVTTIVEYKRTADSTWIVAAEVGSAITSYQFTGLADATQYHWRAKHRRNGQDSTYLGPVAGTTFTTSVQLAPPTNSSLERVPPSGAPIYLKATWVNSGESNVSTEVEIEKNGQGFTLVATVAPGSSSYYHPVQGQTGLFVARVRHVKQGFTASNPSTSGSVTI